MFAIYNAFLSLDLTSNIVLRGDMRPEKSYNTIYITLDGMLAGDLLRIDLNVSVSEYPCSHRLLPSLIYSGGKRPTVLYVVD